MQSADSSPWLAETPHPALRSSKRDKAAARYDATTTPPEIKRDGEMPEGAAQLPRNDKGKGKATNGDSDEGLKAIDLSGVGKTAAHGYSAPPPPSRFEEYRVDGEDLGDRKAEIPAAQPANVSVVKVKKKKKKPVPMTE